MAIRESEFQRSLRGLHVLLVDEDTEALEQIKRGLEYCGAVVTARQSARRALAVLQSVRRTCS